MSTPAPGEPMMFYVSNAQGKQTPLTWEVLSSIVGTQLRSYSTGMVQTMAASPYTTTFNSLLGAVAITSLGLSIYAVVKINEDNKKESN